jgi:hypothetical protein
MRDADNISQPDDHVARLEQEITRVQGEIDEVQQKTCKLEAALEKQGNDIVQISKNPAIVRLLDDKKQLRDKKNKLLDQKKLLLERLERLEGDAGTKAVRVRRAPDPPPCPPACTAAQRPTWLVTVPHETTKPCYSPFHRPARALRCAAPLAPLCSRHAAADALSCPHTLALPYSASLGSCAHCSLISVGICTHPAYHAPAALRAPLPPAQASSAMTVAAGVEERRSTRAPRHRERSAAPGSPRGRHGRPPCASRVTPPFHAECDRLCAHG